MHSIYKNDNPNPKPNKTIYLTTPCPPGQVAQFQSQKPHLSPPRKPQKTHTQERQKQRSGSHWCDNQKKKVSSDPFPLSLSLLGPFLGQDSLAAQEQGKKITGTGIPGHPEPPRHNTPLSIAPTPPPRRASPLSAGELNFGTWF